MAGRAAEEVVFGEVGTGALNDMERATKMAQSMVVYYGMSPKIGNISFYDSSGQSDYGFTKPFSDKTAEVIDSEVNRIVEEAYARAKEIIMSHRSQLDELAGQLYEREVLFRDDLERIYGPREADVIAAQLKEKEEANAPELAEKTESQDDEAPTTEPDNADVSSQSDATPDATT
jgi:cell division protease FtsH